MFPLFFFSSSQFLSSPSSQPGKPLYYVHSRVHSIHPVIFLYSILVNKRFPRVLLLVSQLISGNMRCHLSHQLVSQMFISLPSFLFFFLLLSPLLLHGLSTGCPSSGSNTEIILVLINKSFRSSIFLFPSSSQSS